MINAQRFLVFTLASIVVVLAVHSAQPASPFNLHVQVDLYKSGVYSNCSMVALTDLENEIRDWIDEELHAVLGDDNGHEIPRLVGLELHDKLQVSTLVRCSTNGCRTSPSQSDDEALQIVAKTLQWSAPAVIRRWFVEAGRLVDGCMGDSIQATVTVRELDFDLDARQPIVLGIEEITNNDANATTATFGTATI